MPASMQRSYQREEMTLRMRRPPEEYVSLLSQNEQEFRAYVDTFEDHPLFSKLLNDGMISKVRLRGKIPRARYEEFMDQQLLDFLNNNGIVARDGWERDFLAPNAIGRAPELAEKYSVPVGPLLRQLRYLHSSGRVNVPAYPDSPSESAERHTSYDRTDNTAGPTAMVDLSEIIETTRDFVNRYEVSEQEFLDLILGGEATPQQLSEQFGCSLLEAEEVLEAADRVYLAESYEASGATAENPKRKSDSANQSPEEPVAFVQMLEGELSIQFEHDSVYTQRYHIRPGTMKAVRGEANIPAIARELLTKARFINQRLSALSRLIRVLCGQQLEYLTSGDLRQMKPLAQAELARQLGEHPSTVSRLIRGKVIETPYGRIPLLFLCQSKTDVVARLIGEFPKLTDQEVVSRLREDYNCFIARRTVAYHRGKRLRRNKRRKKSETND